MVTGSREPADRRARAAVAVVFALAMGWLEAVVVVYLRKLIGLEGTLDALSPATQAALFGQFATIRSAGEGGFASPPFLWIEQSREAATIVMLAAAAWLAGRGGRERIAQFFVLFGAWDLAYYGSLWCLLRWPPSLATVDVLFLIPAPWIANVWIPCALSLVFVAGGLWGVLSIAPAGRRRR